MDEPVQQGGGLLRPEEIGPVFEDEVAAGDDGEGERVVGGVGVLASGDGEIAGPLGAAQPFAVDEVVLEHQQGVEEFA